MFLRRKIGLLWCRPQKTNRHFLIYRYTMVSWSVCLATHRSLKTQIWFWCGSNGKPLLKWVLLSLTIFPANISTENASTIPYGTWRSSSLWNDLTFRGDCTLWCRFKAKRVICRHNGPLRCQDKVQLKGDSEAHRYRMQLRLWESIIWTRFAFDTNWKPWRMSKPTQLKVTQR